MRKNTQRTFLSREAWAMLVHGRLAPATLPLAVSSGTFLVRWGREASKNLITVNDDNKNAGGAMVRTLHFTAGRCP